MRDYELYIQYVQQFGLTFLPRKMDDHSWAVACVLMQQALDGIGPEVTHDLIHLHLQSSEVAA